jgi:hypothetical protein
VKEMAHCSLSAIILGPLTDVTATAANRETKPFVSLKQVTPFPLSQFVTSKLQKIRLPGFHFPTVTPGDRTYMLFACAGLSPSFSVSGVAFIIIIILVFFLFLKFSFFTIVFFSVPSYSPHFLSLITFCILCLFFFFTVFFSYGLGGRGVGVRIPVEYRIISSPRHPDRLWGPPKLLYSGYRGFFPGGKAAGA